ncbi:hypothetical protein DFJ77DRAFT_475329 [Powellomyces hirtus]|nr:hypothetical protein DFJ77DRAFT_475329 [Powellomyces hirtus]
MPGSTTHSTANQPHTGTHIPGTNTNVHIPGTNDNVPHTATHNVAGTNHYNNTASVMPGSTTHSTANQPHTGTHIPGTNTNVHIPGTNDNVPHTATHNVAGTNQYNNTNMPGSTTHSTANQVHTGTHIPGTNTNVHVPGTNDNVPHTATHNTHNVVPGTAGHLHSNNPADLSFSENKGRAAALGAAGIPTIPGTHTHDHTQVPGTKHSLHNTNDQYAVPHTGIANTSGHHHVATAADGHHLSDNELRHDQHGYDKHTATAHSDLSNAWVADGRGPGGSEVPAGINAKLNM